eukprot:541937-Amphidinium_carterae.1
MASQGRSMPAVAGSLARETTGTPTREKEEGHTCPWEGKRGGRAGNKTSRQRAKIHTCSPNANG